MVYLQHYFVNYSFNWRVENMILVYGALEIEWVLLNKKPEEGNVP